MSPTHDARGATDVPLSARAAAEDKKRAAAALQRRASDPASSAWVGASAGSGKTKVLTDRVLNLMLAGADPQYVLCLTFTKAAAAEMANRLAARLAEWAIASDEDLTQAIVDLNGQVPDGDLLSRARQLFAIVLDTAGGMKIQTIHAFCQAVLARFPLEAGVPPNFQVLEENSSAEMLLAAREAVLANAGAPGEGELVEALAAVSAHAGDTVFDALLGELIRQRGRLIRLLQRTGGIEGLVDATYRALGVGRTETPDGIRRRACESDAIDEIGLRLAADAMGERGTAKEKEKAAILRAWLEAGPDERDAGFADYYYLFINKGDGEIPKRLLNKAAAEVPGALEAMSGEAERLKAMQRRMNAATVAAATAGLLRLGAAILADYERQKQRRALLDYDDLILSARNLLSDAGRTSWVLYKLDGGLDHVLIDEAQDTNPEQWEVVQALTEEFFAGESAGAERGAEPRTVFAVGDAKQSIYSFQRAEPGAFARMRAFFAQRVRQAGKQWAPVDLHVSFRSTDAVLRAVDAVFARPEAHDGVLFAEDAVAHDPVRVGHAGLVELWPPAEPEEGEEAEPWTPPTRAADAPPARERLARLIAARIARWTRPGEAEGFLEARGRQMTPGDVLVLVRRRNAFVEDLVRALKQRDVPVAGVDRMILTDQLAVKDLVALGRFLLLPEDDLTLACVLKGPLLGLDEDALFDLAHGRSDHLWDALRARAGDTAACEDAYARLSDLLGRADYVPPYEFYAQILGAEGGRRAIVGRLGVEANDPIDEFLSLAMAYEREHVPSLEGFLHWLETGGQEVKRDAEHGSDAVRVMTVHGAKGLEAPVVILPDTLQTPALSDRLLWDEDGGLGFWTPRRDYHVPLTSGLREAAREAQFREYRRLLYVAMTRAEDRLYVCGWNTARNSGHAESWYKLIESGLAEVSHGIECDFTADIPDGWSGPGRRLHTRQDVEPEGAAAPGGSGRREDAERTTTLPDWALHPPTDEPAPPRPLAPSHPSQPEPAVRSPLGSEEGTAFHRGRLIHRLLQSLPDLPPDERRAAGAAFLAHPVHGLESEDRAEILEETLAITESEAFAHLFGPSSRAEVPVVGVLDTPQGPEIVSGQVDRLVLTDDIVIVLDYKTNRPPPRTPEEVPAVYRHQLATYRRLLERVYPGRRIETWLLWTDGPRLMRIRDA